MKPITVRIYIHAEDSEHEFGRTMTVDFEEGASIEQTGGGRNEEGYSFFCQLTYCADGIVYDDYDMQSRDCDGPLRESRNSRWDPVVSAWITTNNHIDDYNARKAGY